MASTNSHIAIIGGSLAGLFAAVVLKSLPSVSKITILERFNEDDLQDLGAGIRIGPNAIEALSKYTNTPPSKYAVHMHTYKFIDRDGNVIGKQNIDGWTSTWGQLYRVLRESFAQDASRCTYRHGCTLLALDHHNDDGVHITYRNAATNTDESLDADLVIGADGASSKTRAIVCSDVSRSSVGYACVRGVVYEADLSEESRALYSDAGTFHWTTNGQLVSYTVPGPDGPADECKPLVNWLLYRWYAPDELAALLTDKNGRHHKFSLPTGGMSDEAIHAFKEEARAELPVQHAEVIGKTEQPFVQCVTDSIAPQTSFWNGKVLLVGDAVGGQRPHTASALLQCAFHAVVTGKLVGGEMDLDTWSRETKAYSDILVDKGKELGHIIMSDMPPPERTPVFFQMFGATQRELAKKWAAVIGTL